MGEYSRSGGEDGGERWRLASTSLQPVEHGSTGAWQQRAM